MGLCSLGGAEIPVEYLSSVPVQHAWKAARMVVDRFETFDAVRLPADLRAILSRCDIVADAGGARERLCCAQRRSECGG